MYRLLTFSVALGIGTCIIVVDTHVAGFVTPATTSCGLRFLQSPKYNHLGACKILALTRSQNWMTTSSNDNGFNNEQRNKAWSLRLRERILNVREMVFPPQTTNYYDDFTRLKQEVSFLETKLSETDATVTNLKVQLAQSEEAVTELKNLFDKWRSQNHTNSEQEHITSTNSHVVISDVTRPIGSRWSISSNMTDLTGKWKPIVTTQFKRQYDEYLKNCSQSSIFRSIVSNSIGMTQDELIQFNSGRNLTIVGSNPAGMWNRTLLSSGTDLENGGIYEALQVEVEDPDKDLVKVESWWEKGGTVHRSMLRGKPRVKGGEFETLRYLDPRNNDVLIIDSYFHPSEASGKSFKQGFVQWRYERIF